MLDVAAARGDEQDALAITGEDERRPAFDT
jgi:hypothetical protein